MQKLAWDPDETTNGCPKFHADGTLQGKYICQYLDQNNNLCTLAVNPGWAESMFGVMLLALVQQCAYEKDAHDKYKDPSGKTCVLS